MAFATALLAEGMLVAPSAVLAVSAPVARWKLDDGTGFTADDDIGTANGTVSGATWLTSGAAVGTGALRFDGVNDKVTVPGSAAIEPAELELTLWVRGDPQDPPAAGEVIIEKGAFDCDGPSYGLYVSANGILLTFRSPNGIQVSREFTQAEQKVNLWDGGWHLLAARFIIDGFYDQFVSGKLIMDGFPEQYFAWGDVLDSVAHTSAIRYAGATSSSLVIGSPANGACGRSSFDGDVDDVRIYTDPFFASETLMPTVSTTWTWPSTLTAIPYGSFNASVDLTPIPRWGTVTYEIFSGGTWTTLGSGTPNQNGHVYCCDHAPSTLGTFPLRATFSGSLPYTSTTKQLQLTVEKGPTSTIMEGNAGKYPYEAVNLYAYIDSFQVPGNLTPQGNVEFYETTSGSPVLLGSAPVTATVSGSYEGRATIQVTTFPGGAHKLIAKYVGPDGLRLGSTSPEYTLTVLKRQSSVTLLNLGGDPVETNHSFQLSTYLTTDGFTYATGATMTFTRVGSATPACVVPVVYGDYTTCTVSSLPVGTYQYVATYSGNTDTAAATSAQLTVNVVSDVVHATGVGAQYTTFYPYTDTYRDTNKISGHRDEAIAVTIKIYNPSGSLHKTVSFPAGLGDYSYVWNGRSSTGSILGEGQYKIVQMLTDPAGTVKTVTSYATISKKHLVYYTKTISKLGSSLTAQGFDMGGGTVTRSTTYGYTKLSASTGSWAGAGWELSMPSAAVYSWFYVRIYGRRSSGTGTVHLGAQQFTKSGCGYSTSTDWNELCFGSFANIPVTSGTTKYYYRTPGLTSSYRSGTKVRLVVTTTGGTVYVYKAEVRVSYGVLSY